LAAILGLEEIGFPVEEAQRYLHSTCLSILKASSRKNKNGFRFSGSYIFDVPAVKNEVQWLLQHLYCSGLDKAANNICLICIRHIRLMALERLMGNDFLPCKNNNIWSLPSATLDQVARGLKLILPEFVLPYQSLPYLMATYKQHKSKYRWLTNAFQTVFSNIATLLTITSKVVLESFQTWAQTRVVGYKNFLRVDANMY
jgi:hypothetical protein